MLFLTYGDNIDIDIVGAKVWSMVGARRCSKKGRDNFVINRPKYRITEEIRRY